MFYSEYDSRDYIEMGYVPSHLHHICFELFKNSMRATIELHGSVDPPPIKILMTKGKDNVCIKITDQGGGASLEECRRWTHYMYSTAPPPPKVRAQPVFYCVELCRLFFIINDLCMTYHAQGRHDSD